jgi:hypothetical protein
MSNTRETQTHMHIHTQTSMPTTSIPTTSIPTTSIPTTSMPTTSIPTTSIPTTFAQKPHFHLQNLTSDELAKTKKTFKKMMFLYMALLNGWNVRMLRKGSFQLSRST